MREVSAVPGEEESDASVQTWLAAGGREDMKPVGGVLPKFKKKYWPVVSTVMQELSFELMGAATFELILKMLL